MPTTTRRLAGPLFVLLALAGCQPTPTSPPPSPPTTTPGTPEDAKKAAGPIDPIKPAGDVAAAKLTDEELAEVKKLPADEQPVALAQMSCPVSGGHLGSMGMPLKQKIGDRSFYLCCEGCEKEVKEHPDAVLAKLPAPVAK